MPDSAVGCVRACVRARVREKQVSALAMRRSRRVARPNVYLVANHLDAILRRGRVGKDFYLLQNIPLAV